MSGLLWFIFAFVALKGVCRLIQLGIGKYPILVQRDAADHALDLGIYTALCIAILTVLL